MIRYPKAFVVKFLERAKIEITPEMNAAFDKAVRYYYMPCKSIVHHGPGHQSRTKCELLGRHKTHQAEIMGWQEEWEDVGPGKLNFID